MCGRYHLDEFWQANLELDALRLYRDDPQGNLFLGSREVFPRTFMPVIFETENGLRIESKRWGFHRTWPDKEKPDKWVKRELINAVGSTVHRLPSFRQAFRETRCLIPMSGWWEWPTIEGKKTRVDITMKTRPTFLAAGLYEVSKDNKTGEPVPTYTLVTTEPNDYLGSAHDRAPLVLEPGQYLDWLAGGDRAMALIHKHDDPAAFNIEVSGDPQQELL